MRLSSCYDQKTLKFHMHHSQAMTETTQFATFICNWEKTWNTHYLHWETWDFTIENHQLLTKDNWRPAFVAHIEFQMQVVPCADTDSFYRIKLTLYELIIWIFQDTWGKICVILFITVEIYPFPRSQDRCSFFFRIRKITR